MRSTLVIEEDKEKKLLLMEERFARCVDFKNFNKEKNYDLKVNYPVKMTYENLMWNECLRQVMPEGIEIPGGFETIGHIAHLNLHEDQMPYRNLIGQIILDKTPNLRTVVTKIGYIKETYRFYELECIAGEPDYNTTLVEDKVRINLDLSLVYWSSKLATER